MNLNIENEGKSTISTGLLFILANNKQKPSLKDMGNYNSNRIFISPYCFNITFATEKISEFMLKSLS